MKFIAKRNIIAAGTQTLSVEAEIHGEAKASFLRGEGVVESESLDVLTLGPWDWDAMYFDWEHTYVERKTQYFNVLKTEEGPELFNAVPFDSFEEAVEASKHAQCIIVGAEGVENA